MGKTGKSIEIMAAAAKQRTLGGGSAHFDFRLILIPALMILVIPFYIYVPTLQQNQLLRLLNETIALARNQTRHGSA